ncbi:NAD(P)-binding protein, partial [Ceratobasidium sp. AG-I]
SLSSLFGVKDKIALISEGCSAVGVAIAAALVQNGAKIYIASAMKEDLQKIQKDLNDKGPGRCEYIVADIGSKEGCVGLCDTFKQRESKLHILVNNSGATWGGEWDEFPDQGWDQAMASQVKSLLYMTGCLTQLLVRDANSSEPGRVVNISSVSPEETANNKEKLALRCKSIHFNLYHDTNKSAVSHLTSVMAISLASKFQSVNAILPDVELAQICPNGTSITGATGSDDHRTERLDSARDVAGVLLFLVSSAGARTTGARI